MISSFGEHGIYPPGVDQLSEDSLVWRTPLRYLEPCRLLNFSNLGFSGDPSMPADPDELSRQAEVLYAYVSRPHLTEEFGLAPANSDEGVDPAVVESIRTTRRVGPDGELLFDLVAEITQRRNVIDPETGLKSKFFGGSTVIIGPEGEFRYIISKNLMNPDRLSRQLDFQRHSGFWHDDGKSFKMRGFSHQLAHRERS